MSSLGDQLTTSVLVVGSGASGLRAAIEVAEAGVAVVVVTQRAREDAQAGAAWDDAEWAPAPARLGDTGERHSAETSPQSRCRGPDGGHRCAHRHRQLLGPGARLRPQIRRAHRPGDHPVRSGAARAPGPTTGPSAPAPRPSCRTPWCGPRRPACAAHPCGPPRPESPSRDATRPTMPDPPCEGDRQRREIFVRRPVTDAGVAWSGGYEPSRPVPWARSPQTRRAPCEISEGKVHEGRSDRRNRTHRFQGRLQAQRTRS
ncbi:FAD-binding protein [Streptomyces sp. NPDC001714]|uniref:FAD-binding protein n=1 Tax=Streptomyces sp. NPDC001714 TaxID=3364603 RepID=UPI003692DF1F